MALTEKGTQQYVPYDPLLILLHSTHKKSSMPSIECLEKPKICIVEVTYSSHHREWFTKMHHIMEAEEWTHKLKDKYYHYYYLSCY